MKTGLPPWATLDTIDKDGERLTVDELHGRLFTPLAANFVGITIGGQAAAHYDQANPWGEELELPCGEQLVLRVSPPDLLARFDRSEMPEHVILVFRRRRPTQSHDEARLCLFWHWTSASHRAADFQKMEQASLTIGGRCSPLFAPRVFCHHDAQRASSSYHGSERWATIDENGFQIVRPHLYSVITEHVMAIQPAIGMSQWSITAAFLGLDLADARRRPLEVIPRSEYLNQQKRLMAAVRDVLQEHDEREPDFSNACANAFLAADALDCLGFINILGSPIYEGAWPDAVHLPSGMPLVAAACIRLATSHRRFGLGGPPLFADELSNDRLRCCFEPTWSAFDDQGNLATDLAIQRAISEASQAVPGDIVREYVQSFRRSGQSCISRIFGLSPKDLEEPESSTSKLYDPVTSAYAAVAKDQIGAESAIQNDGIDFFSPDLCPGRCREQKKICLYVVGSVERWLRLGTIAGSREAGAHDEQMQRRRIITAGELRRIISAGLARTLMLQAGGENEEEAAKASMDFFDRVQDILQECPDSTPVRCPTPEELLDPDVQPDLFSGLDEIRAEQEDALGIDEGCMRAAVRSLKILFSQGPAGVIRLYGLEATLFSAAAKLPCADCDAEVGLLDTFLLQSSCAHCNRPRCLKCAEAAMKLPKHKQPTSCLRCKKA